MIYAVHHFKVSLMSNKCAEFENHHQSYISGHPGKKTYKIHLSHWNWNTTSLVQWASVTKQAETSSCHKWPDRGFFKLSMSGVTVSFVQYMLKCTHLAPSGAPIEPCFYILWIFLVQSSWTLQSHDCVQW